MTWTWHGMGVGSLTRGAGPSRMLQETVGPPVGVLVDSVARKGTVPSPPCDLGAIDQPSGDSHGMCMYAYVSCKRQSTFQLLSNWDAT